MLEKKQKFVNNPTKKRNLKIYTNFIKRRIELLRPFCENTYHFIKLDEMLFEINECAKQIEKHYDIQKKLIKDSYKKKNL